MKRSNFLKSLATLIVAPSLIGKIEVDKKEENIKVIGTNKFKWYEYKPFSVRKYPLDTTECLFSDIQKLQPDYYKSFVDKYGDQNFADWLDAYNS